MTGRQDDETDPRVPALAAGLERVTRRVGGIDALVRQLASDVTRLATHGDPPEPVPDWLTDPGGLDVPGLLGWLDQVYVQFDGAELPPCWAWHPGVVTELAWLYLAHRTVLASGDPCRVGDWHDRYRPGVVRRIGEATRRCGDVSEHLAGAPADRAHIAVPLGGALTAAQTARAAGHPAPYPTGDQVEEGRTRTNGSYAGTSRR